MPADLAHSADVPRLELAIRDLDGRLANSPPLDRDAAWREFAALNPLLADGHLLVGFVDWRGDTRAHLAAGGLLFPFEMRVTPTCELRVRAALGGRTSRFEAAEIRAVNGLAGAQLCEQLLGRVHGETPAFRADLLSRRFFFYYWKVFGAPAAFDVEFTDAQSSRHIAGSCQLPQMLADETVFERLFQLQFTGDSAAILRLASFAWPDKQQLLDFTRDSFAKLRIAATRTLIIDLRDNGGGNDEEWIEGVMPYIADKPFRVASSYRKRVVIADPARGELPGDVVDGPIDSWFAPQADNPLRFTGALYVATGAGTYSSALEFCNVVQDFGLGLVAGPGDSARANLSGGARRTTLTHTGLLVVAPRFVLTRPSGARLPVLFAPDIPFDDSQALDALARHGVPPKPAGTSRR